ARVRGQDGVVGQPASEGTRHALRLERPAVVAYRLLHHLAPAAHAILRLLQKRSIRFPRETRIEQAKRFGCIADETGIDRKAQSDALSIAIDLDAARLARLGIVLDVRKGGADDQKR